MSIISVSGLNKIYRNGALQFHALRDICLEIEPAEFVAIMGPSGSGKTTLLNVLGLLEDFDSGCYQLDAHSVTELADVDKAKRRNGTLGFIFQAYNLIPDLSVEENIALPLHYADMSRALRQRRVAEALQQHNLVSKKDHLPEGLSGGQQQRVAIARAMVTKPQVLLADEPTGNLDSLAARQVMQDLQSLNEQGTTIVMVTHSDELARYAQRRVFLLDGQLSQIPASPTMQDEAIVAANTPPR